MEALELHDFHNALGARFGELNGAEVVTNYGDTPAEYQALRRSVAVLDLSARTRLCLVGADRVRFLHGQVTNDIKRLRTGEGCYAALVAAKGKMQSDLYVYSLAEELLLDAEPGLSMAITQRLEKYIVADDVQVVDVAPHYGLLSVQGPAASQCAIAVFPSALPGKRLGCSKVMDCNLGELYVVNQPRLNTSGFDIFVPKAALAAVADKMSAAAKAAGGRPCGWDAFEIARVEGGIPRFGMDMDETHFPQECGIEAAAVSYSKGCYIGQEVLNRIHTMGHVNRQLRRFQIAGRPGAVPEKGARLKQAGKEVGYLTSTAISPQTGEIAALGYVRREADQPGAELQAESGTGEPFRVRQLESLPVG